MAVICAWRSGHCSVEKRPVEGALTLARGPRKRLETALLAIARHSRTNDDLFVPGVPEAENDDAALDATVEFQRQLELRLTAHLRGAA